MRAVFGFVVGALIGLFVVVMCYAIFRLAYATTSLYLYGQ